MVQETAIRLSAFYRYDVHNDPDKCTHLIYSVVAEKYAGPAGG